MSHSCIGHSLFKSMSKGKADNEAKAIKIDANVGSRNFKHYEANLSLGDLQPMAVRIATQKAFRKS